MKSPSVTPFVGVWIETPSSSEINFDAYVTPFVGVWIETYILIKKLSKYIGHTLRGCVD